jgi:hypothetical protein
MPNLKKLQAISLRAPTATPARRKEQLKRTSLAQGRAKTALVRLYHDDYLDLYQQAVAQVNAERGPLPD